MSDSTVAIRCVDVRKSYPLYASTLEKALDRFGLSALARSRRGGPIPQFEALSGIDLAVSKGERVGIVGRNGAGKTTLLKLITGNFALTSGSIDVDGAVQTLMSTGLGFHPEFTGYENLKSALQYNGLKKADFQRAFEEALEFAELGEFVQQPVSTYSLGMRTRLQFAAATAIKPEILIIDEVLGAGDAYFAGKSSRRIKTLTESGCTLLLVSHSMQQVLQFCERVIWIECGRIVMEGEALPVVRAYEEFSRRLEVEAAAHGPNSKSVLADEALRDRLITLVKGRRGSDTPDGELDTAEVSRWPGKEGLRIVRIRLRNAQGEVTRLIRCGEGASIEIDLEKTDSSVKRFVPVVVVYGEDGRTYNRHIGMETVPPAGQARFTVRLEMEPMLLGGGRYVLSVAAYERMERHDPSAAVVYDLLSRCFAFEVLGQSIGEESVFMHPARWTVACREVTV
jgi:lipopolysaccharide transport system ATP-binding protein